MTGRPRVDSRIPIRPPIPPDPPRGRLRAPRAAGAGITLAAASLLALSPLPVAGDWLVLRDGARIETRGGWEVRGRSVVFTLRDGTLSSLRLDQLDLDLSAAATAEAKEAARRPPPSEEPRDPVLVLTDEDVRHVMASAASAQPPPGRGEEGEGVRPQGGAQGEATAQPPGEETSPQRLEVIDWQESDDPEGRMVIAGILVNSSRDGVSTIRLSVQLWDAEGQQVASQPAQLNATALKPGQRTRFRATFENRYAYSDVRFGIDTSALTYRLPPPPETATRRQ